MATFAEEGYQVLTTEEILVLLGQGKTVSLPAVDIQDQSILESYLSEEREFLNLEGDMNDIVSIKPLGVEPVMCISVADPEHLYLTDGFIPTHNTSNIVFLKSTDDTMIETLEKLSGKRHVSYTDSKQVGHDIERIFMPTDGRVTYTMQTVEEPVISFNDLCFLPERNSVVFRAGDSPVWNRNETILPMSWRLLRANAIKQPGKEYTLQTIPTLSSAVDFDVAANQPDFQKLLDKRMSQAILVENAEESYRDIFGYSDYDVARLDPDDYASDILSIVNMRLHSESDVKDAEDLKETKAATEVRVEATAEHNEEMDEAVRKAEGERGDWDKPIYAEGSISRDDLIPYGQHKVNHQWDSVFAQAYANIRGSMQQDTTMFRVKDRGLYNRDGDILYIAEHDSRQQTAKEAMSDPEMRVYAEAEEDIDAAGKGSMAIKDDFYRFLVKQRSWDFANGAFDREVARILAQDRS